MLTIFIGFFLLNRMISTDSVLLEDSWGLILKQAIRLNNEIAPRQVDVSVLSVNFAHPQGLP